MNTTSTQGLFGSLKTESWGSTAVLGILLLLAMHQWRYYKRTPKVYSPGFLPIPIIGPWIAMLRFMLDPVKVVHEGTAKSKNGMFRIATLQGEYVLVTDREKVTEFLKAPDSVLNAQDGANDQQQLPWTMGYGVAHRTYHTSVVRGPITKDIPVNTPLMIDEADAAFKELIGYSDDWTPVALYDTIAMTVARVASRIYVGQQFCRNEEYLRNAADYAQSVVLGAELLRLFPEWSKSFITRYLPVTTHLQVARRILGPYIQERLDGKMEADGSKPNDLVQRLIDAAPPIEKTVPQLSERVMALNVATIHTTTMVLTAALYQLAEEWDKYAPELRQEIDAAFPDSAITAEGLKSLPKMESFLRESGRFNLAGLMTLQRNARKEFKFSDGTVLPAGSKVGTPSLIMHRDPGVYENPHVFDGWRFLDEKYVETKETTPTTTGRSFHVFGHGRHPCPGRFLATHEMKILMCLLLKMYDFKFADGVSPKPFFLATMPVPDTAVKVQFRRRQT